MREWLWLYPSVEIVHIVGFVILVGSVAMFDLRVLGLSKQISVRALVAPPAAVEPRARWCSSCPRAC